MEKFNSNIRAIIRKIAVFCRNRCVFFILFLYLCLGICLDNRLAYLPDQWHSPRLWLGLLLLLYLLYLNALAKPSRIYAFFRNRYVLFVLFLCLYTQIFFRMGGFISASQLLTQYMELPLLLYLFWYLNVLTKPSRFQPFIAATPLFLCYLGPDISFLFLGRVFRWNDLTKVPELLQVMSPSYLALAGGVVIGCLVSLIFSLSLKRLKMAIFGILPIVVLIVAVGVFPQQFVNLFERCTWTVELDWSDVVPVKTNGRLVTLCYREANRRLALKKTNDFYNREAYDQEAFAMAQWLKEKGNRRNVHLVVMESFVDPTLFQAVKYSKSPVHPDYEKMFAGKMGFSLSPVFGGGTGQAEFEALCGMPAYAEIGSVEFNSFSGAQAWCLPGLLRQSGYRATVSFPTQPTFFNAVKAYRGAGFNNQYYPKEYLPPGRDTYLSKGNIEPEECMFDGDLFAQNREFVRAALAIKDHPPLFNYVLTIYGHEPYELDEKKRPKILKMTGGNTYDYTLVERVANQFWYRSQAVAEHIRELSTIDPESLIIIVSDHLPPLVSPPLLSSAATYRTLRYLNNEENSTFMNRILIIDKGKAQEYKTIHHYDIPRLILNTLTDGEFCRLWPCSFAGSGHELDTASRHQQYMRLMAHAIK